MPVNTENRKDHVDIDPKLLKRARDAAALKGITLKDWFTEAINAKLDTEAESGNAPLPQSYRELRQDKRR